MSDIGSIKTNLPSQTVRKPEKRPITTDVTPVQEEKKTRQSTARDTVASRISRLFDQAGVTTSKYTKLDEDIGKKLLRRKRIKQTRKLENLEKILEKSLDLSIDQLAEDQIDPDWFYSFIDLAENIFSSTMQEIWGKIFAVEISKPGTFSLRTLQTLKQLTQRDAKIFQNAVGLTSRMKGENSPKILFGYYQKPSIFTLFQLSKNQQLNLAQFGLPYPDLLTLMDAGLIFGTEIESGEQNPKRKIEYRFGSDTFFLAPKRSGIFLNYYKFTATGAELAKLVNGVPNENYQQQIKVLLKGAFEVN